VRPDVLALADKVAYRVDTPAARNGDVLEVRMRDGSVHHGAVRALYGSPAAPLSLEALVTKFVDCGGHALRPRMAAQLRQLADNLLAIDQVTNVRALLARL
jgi:hypothetical protein